LKDKVGNTVKYLSFAKFQLLFLRYNLLMQRYLFKI
jgi:hypothetical protein